MLFTNSPTAKSKTFDIYIDFNDAGGSNADLRFPIERISINSDTPTIRFLGVYF
jgi:hypothetical protein